MLIRQILIPVLLIFLSLAGKSQKPQQLSVTGKLDFAAKGERMLNVQIQKLRNERPEFDSCVVKQGSFKFEKMINEPMLIIMSLRPEKRDSATSVGRLDYISLLLVPGEVKISAEKNLSESIVTGKGAVAYPEYKKYNREVNSYIDTMNTAVASLRSLDLSPENRQKRVVEIQDSIKLIRDQQVYLKYMRANEKSPLAALALLAYASEPVWTPRKKMNPEHIEKLLKGLPGNLQSYPSIVKLKEELTVSKSTGIGRPIIDFNLEDTSGKLVKLSDFKGQYVFLDFWASWCVPCRKENPNLKVQFDKYKERGFTIVSVSLDKPGAKQAWLNAIQKDQIAMWTHLGDLNGFDGKVANDYYVKSIPTNFLISPDGKFLGRNLYGEALNRELIKIFNSKK